MINAQGKYSFEILNNLKILNSFLRKIISDNEATTAMDALICVIN
jgi:hypothetical protein